MDYAINRSHIAANDFYTVDGEAIAGVSRQSSTFTIECPDRLAGKAVAIVDIADNRIIFENIGNGLQRRKTDLLIDDLLPCCIGNGKESHVLGLAQLVENSVGG